MTVQLDRARLDRIAAVLPADDATWLAALIDDLQAAPWQRRANRLAARDALVRLALLIYSDLRPSCAARELAKELLRIVATPYATGPRPDLLRKIIALSGGRAIKWTAIYGIGRAAEFQ